jgi:phosphohistidine phosphatase
LVDLIISSPAKRAFDTAIIIAEQLKYKSKIKTDENLYDASADEILKTLKNVDEIFHSILIVAHNPGLTSLSNSLTNYYISNIPTCGVVAINFENEWKNLSAGNCRLLFFEYPKKYT